MGGGGGGKKGGGSFEATDYRLGIHYGVCAGPVDEIIDLEVNDKALGLANVSTNSEIYVDQMNLFGGPKKGGGLRGTINFLLGSASQVLPAHLAAKLGRTPDTVTAYRHICSIWLSGSKTVSTNPDTGLDETSYGTEGFTWSTNIPSVPGTKVKVKRSPKGLSGDAMIGDNANPAHIIYECLTNGDWGAGYDASNVREDTFLDAAQTLRDEDFGLSFIWTGQTTIEAFVNEVLQHISANLVFDIPTAQWSLKLLRGDYDTEAIKEINPRNAELRSFQRKSWGETVNEVIVTWTNPENEEEETVTQQDATGFAVQRTAVSDGSKNYPGIRSQSLAWRVAERDLRQAGTPLASVEVDVDLSLRGLVPGDVLWFNWDDKDDDGDVFLEPFVARVLSVKEPKRGSASFAVKLIEDIFSYGVVVTQDQDSGFYSPDQEPVDPPHVDLLDSPYFVVAQQFGDSAAQDLDSPSGHVSAFVNTGLTDVREVQLYSLRPVPEQSPQYQSVGTLDDLGRFTLRDDIDPEVSTYIPFPSGHTPKSVVVGGFLVIGEGADQEICVVTSATAFGAVVRRGCLDTIPRSWPSGTVAWEVTRSSYVVDESDVLDGEDLDYKLLPVTSIRRLELAEASVRSHTVEDRYLRPLRPANVAVNGLQTFAATISASDTEVDVSWAVRNRVTETSQVLPWTASSVTAEAGQTTEVELLDGAVVLASATGETGGAVTLDISGASLTSGDTLTLRVWAARDGLDSWQIVEIPVSVV